MSASRRQPVVRVVVVLMVVALPGLPAGAKYSGGSGTAKDPYRIATKKDLLALGGDTSDYTAHFVLTADIDLSKQAFTVAVVASSPDVGEHYEFEGTPFLGTFDGRGHKITGLTIDASRSKGYLGLFGCIGRGGLVKGLGLERASIIGGFMTDYVGVLVGLNDGGIIASCSVGGSVTTGNASLKIGALAGMNGAGGVIARCHAGTGATTGDIEVGGLVGANARGARITDCSAGGNVTGRVFWIGGLVGRNEGTIARCQATGGIARSGAGADDLGGLVGWNEGIIIHCQSTGSVAGGDWSGFSGGLAGDNDGAIIDCHATGAVSGGEPAAGLGGLVGGNLGLITHSDATGSITGGPRAWAVGGIVGINIGAVACCYATGNLAGRNATFGGGGLAGQNRGMIINCYATGSVGDFFAAGGLAAMNDGTITNCYAVGKVTRGSDPHSQTGGLIGHPTTPGQVVSSYWDIQTSGQSGSAGGTGKTTAQMQTAQTFRDGGWDFNYIWDIVERGSYPFLRDNPAADLNGDAKVDLRDYASFAANWSKKCGVTTNPKFPLPECPLVGDLNYDKQVDAKDLALLAVQWLDSRGRTAGR